MNLSDIVNGPWAITLPMYREIQAVYARHMRGEKINVQDIEVRIGKPLNNSRSSYEIVNGVAILPMHGVMAKRMNLFMDISGGVSTRMAQLQLQAAVEDPEVKQIILDIESPGGAVDGTQELANAIRAARQQKPVIALADGLMASAGYWAGSAALQVFMASDTTEVGSIGVVATHVDQSRRLDDAGITVTEITAGKYKRIAGAYSPLTEEGRDYIQSQVDHIYALFVDAVAANRGTSAEDVVERMADGRIFIGQQAIDAGLVDGVSTMSELIARASSGEFNSRGDKPKAVIVSGVGTAANNNDRTAPMTMTKETLQAEHPDVYKAIMDAGIAQGEKQGEQRGAQQERDRIKAVEDQAMPGHQALIDTLKFDGKTSGPEAAMAVLAAEKSKRKATLGNLKADADDSKAGDLPPDDPQSKPKASQDDNLSAEEKQKKAWDGDADLRAEFSENFNAYKAYENAAGRGDAKVFGQKR